MSRPGMRCVRPSTIATRAVAANCASVAIRRPIWPIWNSVLADQVCRPSFTGYGGPVSHTPIPLSPTQPRSGQNQPTGLSDHVIQYQYGSTPPYLPPPPSGSNPPPDYRPTIPVLPPTGGHIRKSSKWRLWVIVGSIIAVVLGSIVAGAVGFISHSNYLTAQATTTAHAQAPGTSYA